MPHGRAGMAQVVNGPGRAVSAAEIRLSRHCIYGNRPLGAGPTGVEHPPPVACVLVERFSWMVTRPVFIVTENLSRWSTPARPPRVTDTLSSTTPPGASAFPPALQRGGQCVAIARYSVGRKRDFDGGFTNAVLPPLAPYLWNATLGRGWNIPSLSPASLVKRFSWTPRRPCFIVSPVPSPRYPRLPAFRASPPSKGAGSVAMGPIQCTGGGEDFGGVFMLTAEIVSPGTVSMGNRPWGWG